MGPFSLFDGRLFLSQTIFDLKAIRDVRSSSEMLKAADFSYRSTRDRIVLVCGDLYLQAVAGKSRIAAARVQVKTAEELYHLAMDNKQAGVAPGIDVLRAQVELQAQQERLITIENELEKKKLALARAIGLPLVQQFEITDELSYTVMPPISQDEAVQRAYQERADYQSAMALTRAAEAAKKAAGAERLPSLGVTANYGVNGPTPGQTHGSYSLAAGLRIPIFEGGKVQARIQEADSLLRQRQAELEDLRGRIYYEVRTTFLNLQAADERVKVASSTQNLAQEQLDQAQDRFGAGVASNIEVIQAQEALSDASEAYISSLYAHNSAKGRLALAPLLSTRDDRRCPDRWPYQSDCGQDRRNRTDRLCQR